MDNIEHDFEQDFENDFEFHLHFVGDVKEALNYWKKKYSYGVQTFNLTVEPEDQLRRMTLPFVSFLFLNGLKVSGNKKWEIISATDMEMAQEAASKADIDESYYKMWVSGYKSTDGYTLHIKKEERYAVIFRTI